MSTKRLGGRFIQEASSSIGGVVITSCDVQTDLLDMGHSKCGPFCVQSEPQTASVCVSVPRSEGVSGRRHGNFLEKDVCICVPSLHDDSSGPGQDPFGRMQVLLIAPYWPTRSWINQMIALLYDYPRALPVWNKLLKQPQSNRFHEFIQSLDLHVWPLSGSLLDVRRFQQKCREHLPILEGYPPADCMMLNGGISRNGAQIKVIYLPRPIYL